MKRFFLTVFAAVMFALLPAVAGAAPAALPASVKSSPQAVVKLATLNVRQGPGTSYPVLTVAKQNAALPVIGQFNECAWLKVQSGAGEGWVAGAAKYVTLNVACDTLPAAEAPARVIRTSAGTVTPVEVEVARRFPAGCAASDWICYEADSGYLYLAVWFVPTSGSPSDAMISEFFEASEGVTVVASNGNTTERDGGGYVDGRPVVTFVVPAGDREFKLCWPGNACLYIGSGGTLQPANAPRLPAGVGGNL